jgi:hypothetical protein
MIGIQADRLGEQNRGLRPGMNANAALSAS